MMGFGGYGNGGSYPSPSSSNLSASAPPFTLDQYPKPGPIPLVDLIEPSYSSPMNSSLNNWLSARVPTSELNPVPPPSNAYGYGGLQTVESSSTIVSASADPFGYGQSANNVANPYYPPYLSPTTHKDGSPLVIPDQANYDWSSVSRVSIALDGSSDDYPRRSSDQKYGAEWGDGLWNGFAEWKQVKQGHGSFNSKETDVSVPSMYENYMNPDAEIPKALRIVGDGTHNVDFLEMEKLGGSLNSEKLDEKAFLGKTSSFIPDEYSRSVLGSLSGLAEIQLQPPSLVFGPSSLSHQLPYSASSELQLKQHANDGISVLNSSAGHIIPTPIARSVSSASSNAPFKIGNLGSDIKDFHSQASSENKPVYDSSQLSICLERDEPISLSNKEFTTNDTLQYALRAKSGSGISNLVHDRFGLDLNINEALSTVQESPENVDHYNHAVDSPCWKGVPVSHSSPFDVSEVIPHGKKLEPCNDSNFQPKQAFQLTVDGKISPQKPSENTVYHEVGYLEHSSELPSTTSLAAREKKSDNVAKVGDNSETEVVQHSDDNHEYGSRSEIKSSHIMKKSLQEGEAVNEIVEEALQYCSSRLQIPVEHVISSSVEDTSCTKLNTSTEGPSTPTVDVAALVNTIHNLSEFLLFHCARGSSQLKQKDHVVVQSVIHNLTMCMSKNAEKMAPIQEPNLSETDTYVCLGGLQKGSTRDIRQATKRAGPIQALIDAQSAHKLNKFYLSPKDDEVLDPLSAGSDCNMVDEDKATQAFKKVLTENFNEEETQPQSLLYKNLWLDAEAALCSVNYKARYNRMKIEMEGSKLVKSKDTHENSVGTDTKKPLGSVVSPDSDAVEMFSPKDEGCSAPKSRGPSILSPSSHDDDVMSRFQILRCRVENSNPSTPANLDKPSSSMASPQSGNVAKALPEVQEEKASPKPSSDSDTNKYINDFDASFMARFHILKSRADNFSPSTEVQRPPPPEIKLPRFASQITYWPILGSIPEIGSSNVNNPASDPTKGHFTASEFQMYDQQGQSHGPYRPENLPPQPGYDRVSSDWEHVRKEDLGWQNR